MSTALALMLYFCCQLLGTCYPFICTRFATYPIPSMWPRAISYSSVTGGITKKCPNRFFDTVSRSMSIFGDSHASRPSASHLSLDSSTIALHLEVVIAHLRSRRADENLIAEVESIPELRKRRNAMIVDGDAARGRRKVLSKDIGKLMHQGNMMEVNRIKEQVEQCNALAASADAEKLGLDEKIQDIISRLPNLLHEKVPDGPDNTYNQIVSEWGTDDRLVGEGFLWHDDIARKLGGIDHDAAVRLSGSRFSVLIGDLAKLERALANYFLDFHTSRGYKEVSVPYIVSRSTMQGTGQLPKFEEDMFKINHSVAGEDAFLIPTAEVPVTNLFRDSILSVSQLPIALVCHSPSFRAEVGSAGKDTRGLLRQHQFQKVELVKICLPENSQDEHERLTEDAEQLLRNLKLPYRKVLLCSGDTGFSARMCYDLEVWFPGQQQYREISSCSNCYDFQARRMKLRVKAAIEDKTIFPHTINGSGVAVGRALVAILENYQLPDGSVRIPEVLQPYFGGKEVLEPNRYDFLYRSA